jgi:hypothetical protein
MSTFLRRAMSAGPLWAPVPTQCRFDWKSRDHVISATNHRTLVFGQTPAYRNPRRIGDMEGNIPPANVRGTTSYCSETRMGVVECDVPSESVLGKALIERADFRDAYRAPLRRPEAGVIEIFFAIFAHRPVWMNLLLIARNKVAGFAGLETPTTSEILNMEKRDRYIVGQKIGPWPIFFLDPDELVAGRDNKHMDFRLSIMKVRDGDGPSVVVSTLCMVHNHFGRYYLSSITPFHKYGLRKLMASALAAGRL